MISIVSGGELLTSLSEVDDVDLFGLPEPEVEYR